MIQQKFDIVKGAAMSEDKQDVESNETNDLMKSNEIKKVLLFCGYLGCMEHVEHGHCEKHKGLACPNCNSIKGTPRNLPMGVRLVLVALSVMNAKNHGLKKKKEVRGLRISMPTARSAQLINDAKFFYSTPGNLIGHILSDDSE